jgi:NADP-dependent 3-hydroxy acid dehydrogenase YdfG
MNDRKRIAIIGATSAMAEHCARLWVEKSSVEMILVGRDAQRTERVAADLRVRSPATQIIVM